jgi:hypothetical protein
MTSRFNQPANVALTRLMFRNPGWNSSFVYGNFLRFKIRLILTILSLQQQQNCSHPAPENVHSGWLRSILAGFLSESI